MMLTCIYHLIQSGEKFNPSDLQQTINPPASKKVTLNDQTAIAFYDTSSLVKITVPENLSADIPGTSNSA